MKKKTIVMLSVAAGLILIGAVAGYFAYTHAQEEKRQAENAAYRKENTQVFAMGETVVLSSDEAEQGQDNGFGTAFEWKGTMEATLTSATLYDSPEAAGLPNDQVRRSQSDGEGAKYLQCELTIKNVDAQPRESYDSKGGNYNISTFHLCRLDLPDRGLSYPYPAAYFDGVVPDADPVHGGHDYFLDQGEERTYKIGYLVPPDSIDGTFVYAIGVSNAEKYQIAIDIDEKS